MTNLADEPAATPVKRLRDALMAQCRDCMHVASPGLYWNLSKTMHLHMSGTGHKKFNLYTYTNH